jgi:hypothetical protein
MQSARHSKLTRSNQQRSQDVVSVPWFVRYLVRTQCLPTRCRFPRSRVNFDFHPIGVTYSKKHRPKKTHPVLTCLVLSLFDLRSIRGTTHKLRDTPHLGDLATTNKVLIGIECTQCPQELSITGSRKPSRSPDQPCGSKFGYPGISLETQRNNDFAIGLCLVDLRGIRDHGIWVSRVSNNLPW